MKHIRILFFIGFYLLWFSGAKADNLKFSKAARVTDVDETSATVEFTLNWKNSWRNEYNYDAIYLFGKYQVEGDREWYHVIWEVEGQFAEKGYTLDPAHAGQGFFLYQQKITQGTAKTIVRLKWALAGNEKRILQKEWFDQSKVLFSVQGIEMVYVPTAPYYAGGHATKSFASSLFGIIPPEYDIIGTNNSYTYTASTAALAANPADRINDAVYDASARHDWCGASVPCWWQVDFKSPKTILYFGVSGLCWQGIPPDPAGDWYLEGSADAKTWEALWQGGPEYWSRSYISYPVQLAIRVEKPGAYRYYRVRIPASQRVDNWNNIHVSNIAMTEKDLGALGAKALVMDVAEKTLPSTYPNGFEGFYAMKYELTQEQYVAFLNKLPYSVQCVRTIGGNLDGIKERQYVFGSLRTVPEHRNGIVVVKRPQMTGDPYVFGCDLNPDDKPNGAQDGQTIACNYLTPADMLAYADWCGLRPLSELEFEKMSRQPFPLKPGDKEIASNTTSFTFGKNLAFPGTEKEAFQSGNVHAGTANGQEDGPVRVGSFVRAVKRQQTGNSFWGISDLSGNLAEIYYNAELYGRQFDKSAHGDGTLSGAGNGDVSRAYWPSEPAAFGIRGGDYTSSGAELDVSDRVNALGDYFTTLSERKSTVGFRLGYSMPPEIRVSVLTMENGSQSGNTLARDTMCGEDEYTILGDLPVADGIPCLYTWYCSTDKGISWNCLENEHEQHLHLKEIAASVSFGESREYWYKRCFSSPFMKGESQAVSLLVARGYHISRLRDTMQPCMASPGFRVTTPLPAVFRWLCIDNGKILPEIEKTETSSYYTGAVKDFIKDGRLMGGELRLNLTIDMGGKCAYSQYLEEFVIPWTQAPFDGDEIVTVEDSDAPSRKIESKWGGRDQQHWKLTSQIPGALYMDTVSGILHGMGETMVNVTVETYCADFPDQVYGKRIKETFRDWYFLEPGAPRTLTLLPGRYKMECMGSQGGSHAEGGVGGLGGHVWGYIDLGQVQQFHIYVGRTPYNPTTGGYNGGAGSSEATLSSAGGGATDIRLKGGAWDNMESLKSRIMVAGGGGSGGHSGKGGAGGGLIGGNASNYKTNNLGGCGGTQTRAGYCAKGLSGIGRGGVGYKHGGGGGGGYYGGGGGGTTCNSANCCDNGGGGGSGYVSGYSGCVVHSSGLKFIDAGMESGTHTGKGYVRIILY